MTSLLGEGGEGVRILLFGGTREGRELAEWLDSRARCEVVACSATDYGAELVSGFKHVRPVVGPLDDDQKEQLVSENDFACIVDATHPYAVHITESIAQLAGRHRLPLIRVVREDASPDALPDGSVLVENARQAAFHVASKEGNVLLTTGTKDLGAFTEASDDFTARLYVRVLPTCDSIARTRELGVPTSHIVAMQGPFSREFNAALLRELAISIMVAKASGAWGGFVEKMEAARACGVQVVVIGRPTVEDGVSLDEAKHELEARYGA